MQVFNVWGERVFPTLSEQYYISILKNNTVVTLEDAIFRNEQCFLPANINKHRDFWEHIILKDYPHKQKLLNQLPGITLKEFLNSYTCSSFQGIYLDSVYPEPVHFNNYVPQQFEEFMITTVKEWGKLGVIQPWDIAKGSSTDMKPTVVCPLGIAPNKPRVI